MNLVSQRWLNLVVSGTTLMVVVPVLVIFFSWGKGDSSIWSHFFETQLTTLIYNTLVLVIGVGVLVSWLGMKLATLIVLYEFPFRKHFEWMLMLPLAMPAYVIAFVFIGVFDFTGPIQTLWRSTFGDLPFPPVRSTGGVILVFSLVLYPYVYLLVRSALLRQGNSLIEASRVMGFSRQRAISKVVLPAVRPAIAAGVSLALMETLADFGTVSTFNYTTFTTAIYKSWYGLRDLHVAAQLASLLMVFVFIAIWLEQQGRKRNSYQQSSIKTLQREKISGLAAFKAIAFCSTVLLFAFVIPVIQLIVWVLEIWKDELTSRFFGFIWHTMALGLMAGVITLLLALAVNYRSRFSHSNWPKNFARIANLGYAIPSSILAVGIIMVYGWLDTKVVIPGASLLGLPTNTTILTGSLAALLMAYTVRFMAVASGPLHSGLQQLKPSLIESSRLLGASGPLRLKMIHWPALRPGILTAFLVVLVDVMKEMPATLIMRPFGWDTLAVRIYEMTSEGMWEQAALPSLVLLLVGLLPVVLLVRSSRS